MDLDPEVRKALEDALDTLYRMERLAGRIDREQLLGLLELLSKVSLEDLTELIERMPQTELDMRMARLRIQAKTGVQPPSILSDPDRTPVEPLQARRRSSASLRVGDPQPRRVDTHRGIAPPPTDDKDPKKR